MLCPVSCKILMSSLDCWACACACACVCVCVCVSKQYKVVQSLADTLIFMYMNFSEKSFWVILFCTLRRKSLCMCLCVCVWPFAWVSVCVKCVTSALQRGRSGATCWASCWVTKWIPYHLKSELPHATLHINTCTHTHFQHLCYPSTSLTLSSAKRAHTHTHTHTHTHVQRQILMCMLHGC